VRTWAGRPATVLAGVALAVAGSLVGAAPASASPGAAGAPVAGLDPVLAPTASAPQLPGLPAGAPPAAFAAAPALPEPPVSQWPFPADAFPHTEGTSRLDGGALYYTGFLYGDHGAKGIPVGLDRSGPFGSASSLSPPVGTYVYPSGPADGNGANIFEAAVGLARGRTWWRADWTTLADPAVPIAEWAIGTGTGPTTSTWPANAGVRSPGETDFLLVSSKGAWLIDARGHRRSVQSLGGTLAVDVRATSFIVSLPTAAFPPRGSWQVRLVAGLANADGTGFATVPAADGAAPGEPNVYDVGFQSYEQEPPQLLAYRGPDPAGIVSAVTAADGQARAVPDDNFWDDGAQAVALAEGTVAPFSATVDWADLAARRTTPAPHPTGWSDRWYVSTEDFGPGVSDTSSQVEPNFLGRVQPYGIFVPTGLSPTTPAPLTWLLHSLDVNLNQYAVLSPHLLAEACQDRGSICVTPESRGLAGWYLGYAQVDFWQVWAAVARAYRLDPAKTVLSGYSMGGYGTYEIGLEYPDLFAGAVVLSGPPVCGIRVAHGVDVPAGPGLCTTAGDTAGLVGNARWLPFVIEQGAADELVPVAGVLYQVSRFDQADERYRFELYPAEDHLVNATQDGFRSEYRAIGSPSAVVDPGTFTFTWYPAQDQPALGIGPTGSYWVRGLVAASSAAGQLASVSVASRARPEPAVTVERSSSVDLLAQPTPRLTQSLSWVLGPTPPPAPTLSADFSDVAAATVDLSGAGFRPGEAGTAHLGTNHRLALTLTQLAPGTAVDLDGRPVGHATGAGTCTVTVAAGSATVTWGAGAAR
jgi:poly(3-hydroxybutyrate) depolymerase